MFTDYYFWFLQPSSFLDNFDKVIAVVFAALLAIGIILKLVSIMFKNPIVVKLLNRFYKLTFWTGLFGLIWFGFRYENTPIFAKRFWAAAIVILGMVWLGWVVKYLAFNFFAEKKEFESESLKRRYIP